MKITDQKIARMIILAIDNYENGKTSIERSLWDEHIEPFLNVWSNHSAFALTLKTFGWQYPNDVYDICTKVIKMK